MGEQFWELQVPQVNCVPHHECLALRIRVREHLPCFPRLLNTILLPARHDSDPHAPDLSNALHGHLSTRAVPRAQQLHGMVPSHLLPEPRKRFHADIRPEHPLGSELARQDLDPAHQARARDEPFPVPAQRRAPGAEQAEHQLRTPSRKLQRYDTAERQADDVRLTARDFGRDEMGERVDGVVEGKGEDVPRPRVPW